MRPGRKALAIKPNRIKHDVLRAAALLKNPNVAELCRNAKIHRTTYYDILNGSESTGLETLAAICKELDLSLNDVLNLEMAA